MSPEGIKRATTRLAMLLLIAGVAACARIDHNPNVVQGEPVPVIVAPPVVADRLAPGHIRVESGNSLYVIARENGVALRSLIDANGLKAPYVIFPGQVLKLPGKRIHVVQQDESIYAISQRFGVDMGELVRINKIPPPYRIEKGQRLRLPKRQGSQQAAKSTTQRGRRPQGVNRPIRPVAGPARLPTPDRRVAERPPVPRVSKPAPRPLREPVKRSSSKFLWPVRGRLLVGFGPRKGGFHNDGINIAAPAGTPVRAAENGVIVYAGNQLQGFGNMVLIKHSDGWMTAYAHNSRLMVNRGDAVRRGQMISRVGRSGNVSQSQLHFELRRGNQAVDPRRYLVRYALLRLGTLIAAAGY
ncbi:MAG: murein DD-endopeptidase MepM/ murein hydrolase activator NlpD [Alphaproteobacteria bacterium]|jgi:murein DD-endopeptidase MepM/ murein hydrolase activator NlpD